MRKLAQLLAAAFRAVSVALIGFWQVAFEAGKRVLRWIPGAAQPPVPPVPAPVAEPKPEEVADGLKRWTQERAEGLTTKLPSGIKPAEAAWAARLYGRELQAVAKSSPAAIAAHITGKALISGVRPTLAVVEAEPDWRAEKEARKAEMRAAIARSAAADRERRARWAAAGGDPFAIEEPRLAV